MATVIETTEIPRTKPVANGRRRFQTEESVNRFLMKNKNYEYVSGKMEKKNMPNAKHSGVATRLSAEIWFYLKKNKIGRVYTEAHFQIGEDKRVPDVAFVSAHRIPADGEPQKFWSFAPDLAVEIISPTDFYQDVMDKVKDYFIAGVKQVWVINPDQEDLAIFTTPRNPVFLSKDETLTCEEILPDFRLKISEIFID